MSGCAVFLALCTAASAAEDRKTIYLIGVRASLAGVMAPSGLYASSFTYLYSGQSNDASLRLKGSSALDLVSLTWISSQKVLGGNFGLALYVPIANQKVTADINPGGLRPANWTRISDSKFGIGDPLASAFIGWNSGNFHWKVSGVVNIPVGSNVASDLANVGFNRWAGDLTGSLTWLDPASSFEFSISPGVTFHGANSARQYKTGAELHVEAAVMRHVSKAFAFGVAGYHLRQLTGDSGAGAALGPFKGEVSAIGPNVTYNFQMGGRPVYSSIRFYREFNAKNRVRGNVGLLTLTIPVL